MKKVLIIGIVVVLLGAAALGAYGIMQNTKLAAVRNLTIAEIDLSTIADGVYRGSYQYSNSRVEVEITVSDYEIAGIQVIENRETKYATMAETVLERIVANQSLQVDVVTGATTTSKALLKAVENALLQKSE